MVVIRFEVEDNFHSAMKVKLPGYTTWLLICSQPNEIITCDPIALPRDEVQ